MHIDDTRINSIDVKNVDGDEPMEIITGGYYTDGQKIAQLVVWDGVALTPENITTWYWINDTEINSVVAANVDDDTDVEIVTGGYYNDGVHDIAQLVTWNGANLAYFKQALIYRGFKPIFTRKPLLGLNLTEKNILNNEIKEIIKNYL